MTTIRQLLKDRETYTVEGSQSVFDVTRFMVERNIGAVPVLEGGKLVGIFSERDIMKRVLAEGKDPKKAKVSEVMTLNPLIVTADESFENCMLLMKQHGFRHLPILDDQKLVGLLSLRDLLLHEVDEKDGEVRMMRAYMHSMPGES
ncbi:MAG: CBS domain-containing protein [Candidatus Koribacter versatilis]|uniref:CBS domain-containing protein n=1 Tax=Candidatus Korobacter versatilis TaxID=658062 RepID=A0A932A8F0_9BACT|nr:CBS domain-containing protein [Candidatus Koribacter versatilis]